MNQSLGRIAVVEDNLETLEALRSILELEGYEVQTHTDGASMVKAMKSSYTRPDVILTDLIMPNITGFELIAILKRAPTWKSTPVIVITGRDVIHLGVPVIKKPFRIEVLLDAIEGAMGRTSQLTRCAG